MSTSTRPPARVLGIDIGGTGIKGAPVDTRKGVLLSERHRILTPKPAVPEAVAEVVGEIVDHFAWTGSVGMTFPGVVKNGVTLTAVNLVESWTGLDADGMLTDRLKLPVHVLNDADAAGLAEMKFGAGKGRDGVVLLVTLGTGIGTAVFLDGKLLPNTELGHIEMNGKDAETQAAERVRIEKNLSWKRYARRLDDYLGRLEFLLWPDLIIIGGGASQDADKFIPRLNRRTEVVPAALRNDAGIVGGALAFEN
ncbi:MAG: polyphosphate--glucose phosphotransferase [Acidimicrobiales bacterium]